MKEQQVAELEVDLCLNTEWDEFWSYVGGKRNQRWTWYFIDKKTGIIIAWENGKRKDSVLKKLLKRVEKLPIKNVYTDAWMSYGKLFPERFIHHIGKDETWKIERKNLNFRTHLKRLQRRTICFSKDEQIHDNIISMYIEKYYYKSGTFSLAVA